MAVSSDLDLIKRIVDAFERSDWTEIDVRAGSLRVHLSTQALASADPTFANASTSASRSRSDANADPGDAQDSNPPGALTKSAGIPAGARLVVSPCPGIFWRSPQPGAPPFADVGDEVGPSSTMCIVEVMKLMTHVKAAVAGNVVGVFAEDGERVDQGDALFAIAPET